MNIQSSYVASLAYINRRTNVTTLILFGVAKQTQNSSSSSLLEAHPYGAYKKKKEQKLVTWTFSRVHVASLVFIPFSFEKYQNDMITLILFGVAKWSQNSSSSSLTDRLERNMMSTWAFYWTTQTKYSDNQWWGPSEEAMAMWFHLVSCLYSSQWTTKTMQFRFENMDGFILTVMIGWCWIHNTPLPCQRSGVMKKWICPHPISIQPTKDSVPIKSLLCQSADWDGLTWISKILLTNCCTLHGSSDWVTSFTMYVC